ncbi:tetratricopeptide repeat protein [Methylovulum psychrotolerans]|uniref:TPR repeat-containing protein YrrB n=1 Tax=Methylovulum psychrotolerans TaxID=1704499 RepID=A0A2S5CSZ7_9GAMM|nr:tetratricopeptide repeat protein [Methylovulum psychrotolerans]POZ53943.1 TPR repeat-containing protein YrrB [Methylovulum psychrotolerans]
MSLEDPLLDEEDYQTFARALQWQEGFGLFFAVCTPIQAERLIARVEKDMPSQAFVSLVLEEPIDNLYAKVEAIVQDQPVDVLFIQGLEKSLVEYIKPGYGGRGNYYKEDSVPRILGHLNLQRERFRESFKNTRFVFLLPLFALRYFILRAPDFFDWRSGVFEFATEENLLKQEIAKILSKDFDNYQELTEAQRHQELLEIQALIAEPNQSEADRIELYHKHISLLGLSDMYEEGIISCDKVLQIKADDSFALETSVVFLQNLGRMEEALGRVDGALANNSEKGSFWLLRCVILLNLKRTVEAVESAEQLTKLRPQAAFSWWLHGFILAVSKDYKGALKSLDDAKKIAPKNASIWQLRGHILEDLERYPEALSSYNKAIALDGNDFNLFFRKSVVLLRLKHYKDVMVNCDQALQLKADDWRILSIRAEAACHLEKYAEAVDDYEKAIQKQANNYNIWHNKGTALVKLKRYEEALVCYDKALALSPENVKSWAARSRVLSELGRCEEAIDSFEKVVEQSDDKAQAWVDFIGYLTNKRYAYIYLTSEKETNFGVNISDYSKNEAVIVASQKAIAINPDLFDIYYALCFAKAAVGEFDFALKAINMAIKLKEKHKKLYLAKAMILVKLKFYEQALEVVDKSNHDTYYWLFKAGCFIQLRRYQEAVECYKSAMRLDKNNVDLYVQSAMAAIQLKDSKTAIVYLNQAIRLKPSCAQAWFLHGWLNATLGKPKKQVLADFAKATQFNPNKGEAALKNSRALFMVNYNDEAMLECRKALQAYDELIQTNATDASAFYNRACCYALLGEANAALTDLSQAISLNPAYAGQAAEHSDFASLTANADFQLLTHSDETNATVAKEKSPVKKQGLLAYQDNGVDLLTNYLPSMDLTLGALQTKTAANPFTLSASQNWR